VDFNHQPGRAVNVFLGQHILLVTQHDEHIGLDHVMRSHDDIEGGGEHLALFGVCIQVIPQRERQPSDEPLVSPER